MTISFHPKPGALLLCDYDTGFRKPEMVKRRPVVVISPPISSRGSLCTVVPLSTTAPKPVCLYHCRLIIDPVLPKPWDAPEVWAKCDMVFAASFSRLNLIRTPKVFGQAREYRFAPIPSNDFAEILACVLHSIGLSRLTPHL
jgi:mRNA interferase MazF